jgi:hypothetical protein
VMHLRVLENKNEPNPKLVDGKNNKDEGGN